MYVSACTCGQPYRSIVPVLCPVHACTCSRSGGKCPVHSPWVEIVTTTGGETWLRRAREEAKRPSPGGREVM